MSQIDWRNANLVISMWATQRFGLNQNLQSKYEIRTVGGILRGGKKCFFRLEKDDTMTPKKLILPEASAFNTSECFMHDRAWRDEPISVKLFFPPLLLKTLEMQVYVCEGQPRRIAAPDH